MEDQEANKLEIILYRTREEATKGPYSRRGNGRTVNDKEMWKVRGVRYFEIHRSCFHSDQVSRLQMLRGYVGMNVLFSLEFIHLFVERPTVEYSPLPHL